MKRFLISDAHEVVRVGLKCFIELHFGESAFGEATSASDALRVALEQLWDVAILDSTFEDGRGLEVLRRLKEIQPQLPILVLSTHSDVESARRVFQAGAVGYISKDSPREELVKAINNVIGGHRYVSSALAESLAGDPEAASGQPLHHNLSYRELELMCLMASGKTVCEIAGLLELSEKTVSTYRVRLLEKMRMKSNAEIIRYAILNQLGDLPRQESKHPARRIRNVEPVPAEYSAEPPAQSSGSQAGGSQTCQSNSSTTQAALRLRVRSGLIPYMGSSGASQLLESLGDDEEELGKKVESLLQAFLGGTAGSRLASRIMNAPPEGE
jgi:two-component system invasion response regulator UvrY